MREAFTESNFREKSLAEIQTINGILREYQAGGYDLTLRQLYYQLVARGIIENSEKSYNRIGELVNKGRLAGLIDWDMITDRGRETIIPPNWDGPGEILRQAAKQFRLDLWEGQPNHVEVMVEKQALEGVLIPVCNQWGVGFTANKGYGSSSILYETGKRLADYCRAGKTAHILYLGDHDPSGLDMGRDIRDRLDMFSGCNVEVNRLALNLDQVQTLKPPNNPAKMTDSRYKEYRAKFGDSSWELDAIDPRNLADLVSEAIQALIEDRSAWRAALETQRGMAAQLLEIADQLDD